MTPVSADGLRFFSGPPNFFSACQIMGPMPSVPTGLVRLGADVLIASGRLRGSQVGIVCNPASVDHTFAHVVDRLAAAPEVGLRAIFGPQHGFRSDVQDNMVETAHTSDPSRRVPIYSLYS